jgi:hypothetical protein
LQHPDSYLRKWRKMQIRPRQVSRLPASLAYSGRSHRKSPFASATSPAS